MRLIDADKLKNTLIGLMDTSSCVPSDNDCTIDGMLNLLEFQPTVDPVKHGHWTADVDTEYEMLYICSLCGKWVYDTISGYSYCPYCGAKMDKND